MTEQINKSFTIMGSSFIGGAGALIDRLKPNQMLALAREPTNQYDANAVRIMWGERALGFLPRKLAAEIAPIMDAGISVIVRKASPLKSFGAYRGILELAYFPPEPKEVPNVDPNSQPAAGTPS
jgi:hypothetical protein